MNVKPKRQKHNYTSELELKSLLIRSKNKRLNECVVSEENDRNNRIIDRYIKTYTKLNNKNYKKKSIEADKCKSLKIILKQRIITMSEQCFVSYHSNERFGVVILLMIKSILTKPNFSGYTYHTEFYSDAISKILKYLHNFNHKMISKISGTFVNSFAYISQIIHNSIIFVINKKKKEQNNINKQVSNEILSNDLNITDHRKSLNESTIYDEDPNFGFAEIHTKEYIIDNPVNLIQQIKNILEDVYSNGDDIKPVIKFPKDAVISMEDYCELQPLLKSASIIRAI